MRTRRLIRLLKKARGSSVNGAFDRSAHLLSALHSLTHSYTVKPSRPSIKVTVWIGAEGSGGWVRAAGLGVWNKRWTIESFTRVLIGCPREPDLCCLYGCLKGLPHLANTMGPPAIQSERKMEFTHHGSLDDDAHVPSIWYKLTPLNIFRIEHVNRVLTSLNITECSRQV